MRIKSYFDSSVQTAMRQARNEFGDDVMLVTSRVASPEFRHLGDYEVVFATDEREAAAEPANVSAVPVSAGFEEIFRQQLGPVKLHRHNGTETSIGTIHSSMIDIGFPTAMAETLTALIRSTARSHVEHPVRASTSLLSDVADRPETTNCHSLPILAPWPETLTDHLPDRPAEPAAPVVTTGTTASQPAPLVTPDAIVTAALSASSPAKPVPKGISNVELVGEICETVVLRSLEWKTVNEISRKSCLPAACQNLQTSRVRTKSGFVMMLAAFGLYGMIRRSGS